MDRFIELLKAAIAELDEGQTETMKRGLHPDSYLDAVGYLRALRDVGAEIDAVRKRMME